MTASSRSKNYVFQEKSNACYFNANNPSKGICSAQILKTTNSNLVHVNEDEGLALKDVVDHDAKDAHHSGTAVVELNIELAGLLLGVLDVVTEVTNTVVTVVLGGGHPGELNKSEEGKDLEKTGSAAKAKRTWPTKGQRQKEVVRSKR